MYEQVIAFIRLPAFSLVNISYLKYPLNMRHLLIV